MTIVNKPKSSKSKKSSSRRSGKSKKPCTKKMKSRTANWGRIPPAEDSNQVSVAQGRGGAIYCRSSEKSKPFAQRDLIINDGIAPPQRILFPPEKICMDWQQTQSVGVGLYNLGNTCFLNSTLQCLTYTPPLANYMLSLEHNQSCREQGFCMMCTMETHINQALCCTVDAIKPTRVINDLRRIGKHFRFGSQEDAHEFLRYTVDAMQKACLNGSTKLDRSSQATTIIHQIFGGFLRSRVKCLNCKAVSDTYEAFLDITLDIKAVSSVTRALELFVKPEQLDGENCYKCSKCKKMVPASKRFTIHRSSNVLTISLKRFANFTGGKINKEVKYPEYLDLRAYMSQSIGEPLLYALYAVLVHNGINCHAGHYVCYIKAGNGLWYQMNDANVVRTDIKTVLGQQAYLLFYIRRYDLTLGERAFYLPAPSYPRSFLGQRGANSKQTGFMGPRLPPHMIKNSSRLNGNGSLKEDPNTIGVTLKRPSSAPPTACVQNWAITRPSITDPSKKQKITISIHNKLPARQTVSQPDCLSSAVEDEDLNKAVPSSTITNSTAAESTSNPSIMSVTTVSKQEVSDEIFVEPTVNGNPKLSSDNTVPYGAESSGKSEEESKGLFKRKCNVISSNGILVGKVVRTLQNSHSSCQNAEEERSQHELPKNDSLNGAISLVNESKENGLKLDDSTCQAEPVKPSEMFFSKTNGLLETMPIAMPPVPQEVILESLTDSQLNSLSEEISVPGPQKSTENDALMETVVMEALLVYEESRKVPSDFSCEAENPFIQSDSETISTKEEVGSIITKADNAHPSINGQHKIRERCFDTEDEFLEQYRSEDRGDKDKPRRSKEPELISKENILYIKESSEADEDLRQTSSLKSDSECSSKNLSSLAITDKCQDTKDISNNYVEVPPVNDSSITKLDKVLESQFSRPNEEFGDRKWEEDAMHRKKDKKKIHETKKTDKEHYRRKREHSDTEEKESQNRSKTDGHSSKRRCSRSVEVIKQNRHKQEYCEGSKYRSFHSERNSPDNGRRSVKYSKYRSRSRGRSEQDRNRYYHSKGERTWSRERYYQDEPRRWEKCRYYNDYYSSHATGDSRERKFSHGDKDFDKLSQAYNSRSHKDYHYKSRWPHSSLSREEDVHHFSSHRVDLHRCSVPQQHSEKYSRERHALPPVSGHFEDSPQKNEKERNRKRQYSRAEGSESEIERKRRKIEKELLGDEKMKKYKKLKKKKKSKDKHREKDYKLYDLDFSVLHFDNDNRKRKKKKKKKKHIRKLKGFLEYLDPRFQKKTREKKEESRPPDGSFCEQYRNEGSKQPYKVEKPSSAGESKKYSSTASNEYIKDVDLPSPKHTEFTVINPPEDALQFNTWRITEVIPEEDSSLSKDAELTDGSLQYSN
ncbi:ubiquitin carboxyl-terminal hydrolase 42 isoform X1 [Aythya fuligula]|uniref:ubiquitinyl hydrolase 1 n=1 Tax=Aythya fuligula TaxID=219594 RepID=A0A6J3DSZ7_AYTFU|nr:ubiquitin carboxyl-terminal hydrolase 42 isoform X1 [Aythya fuligula]XP_032053793.1 ubiquitin carboxyl-terminal hydrolase 42 isoform X1 [Aythya fuligula]XP_032053794.1 ubiquitin carboxyl-terminal hydrolase 42 isoform X1 [Aythya fuligula]